MLAWKERRGLAEKFQAGQLHCPTIAPREKGRRALTGGPGNFKLYMVNGCIVHPEETMTNVYEDNRGSAEERNGVDCLLRESPVNGSLFVDFLGQLAGSL